MKINYAKYIGIPFEYGGRDSESLDCYGLVKQLYKEVNKVDIKDVKSASDLKMIAMQMTGCSYLWKKTQEREGTVVLLSVRGLASHVGFVIGRDKFIHTWEKSGGVTIERLSTWKNKIIGFYEYAE
jgi:cell wall-associated NlpC family hydrolase